MCIPPCAPGARGEVPIVSGCTTAAACVGWAADSIAGGDPGRRADGEVKVKKTLALVAAAGLAALTGCSVSAPAPAGQAPSESVAPASGGTETAPSTDAGATAAGAREACGRFNSLFAEYAAVRADDPAGYEDIYLQAEDAKDAVAGDLRGLFASLSLLAIDHSSAAEAGGVPAQESRDAVRDAVFANSGTCTAEGVTLRL
jgi:hypothetical protein